MVTAQDIDKVVGRLELEGKFGADNRAGIPDQLHRVSVLRRKNVRFMRVRATLAVDISPIRYRLLLYQVPVGPLYLKFELENLSKRTTFKTLIRSSAAFSRLHTSSYDGGAVYEVSHRCLQCLIADTVS